MFSGKLSLYMSSRCKGLQWTLDNLEGHEGGGPTTNLRVDGMEASGVDLAMVFEEVGAAVDESIGRGHRSSRAAIVKGVGGRGRATWKLEDAPLFLLV